MSSMCSCAAKFVEGGEYGGRSCLRLLLLGFVLAEGGLSLLPFQLLAFALLFLPGSGGGGMLLPIWWCSVCARFALVLPG
jgi:hypothetical protein